MKAKDIKPGVVYGYRASKYAGLRPVVFLTPVDTDHVYGVASRWREAGSLAFEKRRSGTKPRRGTVFSDTACGYPAVTSYGQVDVEALTAATLAEFEAATSSSLESGVNFELITTLGHVVGLWEEAVTADQAERAARDVERDREANARLIAKEQARSLQVALAALSVQATTGNDWHPETLVLSLDDVAKLLALIPAEQSSPSQGGGQ